MTHDVLRSTADHDARVSALILAGRRSGETLVMRYDGRHPDTKRRIAGTMTWRIGKDGFSLSNSVTDVASGATWRAGEMTFKR